MAQCATTALAGAVPCPCVRGARGRFGGLGPVPGVVSLPFLPSRPACPALRVAGRPVRVSLTLARWYAIPRGLCVPRARSGCPSGSPRVPFACVCARAPAASAPPPLRDVACAPRAVPALGAGRAVPRGPCPSACPAPVPCSVWRAWGGAVRSRFPPTWLWVRGGRHEGTRGGRLLPGCGASRVGRSPTRDCPPSGRATGAHYPLAVGAGGCGRGDPSPTPQRALLRAGFARCGGGMRVPGGGTSCLGVGRPGSGALPPPVARPLGGLPGPTTHWLWVRGGAGVGTRHHPHSARSCELALCALGAARGRPGGGASCLDVGRPGSGALPAPTALPLGGLPGPTTQWLWVRGGADVGTRHQPHSARSCVLWGRHEDARGWRLLPGRGASGFGCSPTPNCQPSGRADGAHYPLAVGAGGLRAWGPVTNPTARALASWLCALCGRHEGARGGRLLPGCGASGVGRSPTPDCPPSGRAAGAHYPLAVGAGGCRRGDPSPTPQRALLPAVGAA